MLFRMSPTSEQGDLFDASELASDEIVVINERCRLQQRDGYSVVMVGGIALAHYETNDRAGEAHAMVSLVDQGLALQTEVARAFGKTERTVRRYQRRFDGQLRCNDHRDAVDCDA